MGKQRSLRSKAVHFVSDLTTVLLNPISDKPPSNPSPQHPLSVDQDESKKSSVDSITEEDNEDSANGPDTSSFKAFLYSLLSASEPGDKADIDAQDRNQAEMGDQLSHSEVKENGGAKKGLLSKGKQSLKTIYQFTRISGGRGQERKGDSNSKLANEDPRKFDGLEMKDMPSGKEPSVLEVLPDISEPSLLLSEKSRTVLYASLPALVKEKKWLLLYSTWRHGISLSTLYRRSTIWPGPSLLVVGDRKGAVFGGLVEAPLRPTTKKYQGTNTTFVFTNTSGSPVIFRPTGANRYFTLCSTDFLAVGGGGHFALYLDNDLSAVSETYGNPCLAFSEDFEIKEVELWGFVYGSKYDELLASSRREAPGICRW
ncbi:Oxidation resistance protein 1 [Linum perenne]